MTLNIHPRVSCKLEFFLWHLEWKEVNRSDKVWPKNTFSGVQEILLDEIKNSHRSKIKLKFTQKTNL